MFLPVEQRFAVLLSPQEGYGIALPVTEMIMPQIGKKERKRKKEKREDDAADDCISGEEEEVNSRRT